MIWQSSGVTGSVFGLLYCASASVQTNMPVIAMAAAKGGLFKYFVCRNGCYPSCFRLLNQDVVCARNDAAILL